MNSRIKELAEQARKYADHNEEHWKSGPSWDSLFEQKFAELIVKACINKQLELAADLEVCPEGYEPVCPEFVEGTVYGLKEGAELIGQHFGVEE